MIELPTSERLNFRHLVPGDADSLKEFFASGEALKFLSIQVNDPEAASRWITRQLLRYENYNGLGLWGFD